MQRRLRKPRKRPTLPPRDVGLRRLTSARGVNECVDQFGAFSRAAANLSDLRTAFRAYRDMVLNTLKLRRVEAGDSLDADILLINARWELEASCATNPIYRQFLPKMALRLSNGPTLQFEQPHEQDGVAIWALWESIQGRSGVSVAENIAKSGETHFYEELNERPGYKCRSVGNLYKPAGTSPRPYRSILSAPIMCTREAGELPLQKPVLECIGVLNITHTLALSFNEEDCAWAQICAASIGSLHASFFARYRQLANQDSSRYAHLNEVILEWSRDHPVADRPTSPRSCAQYKGKVDFGIITIKPEENQAVLRRLPAPIEVRGQRTYNLHELVGNSSAPYQIATVRQPEQGNMQAALVTRDLIADLDPHWILLVGIGGAPPSNDVTLGDVVLGMRILDFSISAAIEGGTSEPAIRGEGGHGAVQNLLADLPSWEISYPDRPSRLGDWQAVIPSAHPVVPFDDRTRYYGEDNIIEKVGESLRRRFGPHAARSKPRFIIGTIGTSNALVKDTKLAAEWKTHSREIHAVEMEASGVFSAAKSLDRTYPVLAVRGISDVVGFRRDEAWTEYACESAAAFAVALLRGGPVVPRGG
jgi:nucleoside phosphorylase